MAIDDRTINHYHQMNSNVNCMIDLIIQGRLPSCAQSLLEFEVRGVVIRFEIA
jgi:hypothetical protein